MILQMSQVIGSRVKSGMVCHRHISHWPPATGTTWEEFGGCISLRDDSSTHRWRSTCCHRLSYRPSGRWSISICRDPAKFAVSCQATSGASFLGLLALTSSQGLRFGTGKLLTGEISLVLWSLIPGNQAMASQAWIVILPPGLLRAN